MQKALFDLLLKYTGWLRGYRTLIGLFLNAVAVVFAIASMDLGLFLTSSTAFVGTLMVVIGLRPEPADALPVQNDNWDVLR